MVEGEALDHYLTHRFRCRHCTTIFCSQCKISPYHLGKTCRQYIDSLQAKKCRFCGQRVSDGTQPYRPDGYVENWMERWRRKRTEHRRRQALINLTHSKMQTELDKQEAMMEALGEFFLCSREECLKKASKCCVCVTPCQHLCGGVRDEVDHLPCLKPSCCSDTQTSEDYCNICWVDELGAAPTIQLSCGHRFHCECVEKRLEQGSGTPYISFKYANCPLCQVPIDHPSLNRILHPIREKEKHVRNLAYQRLKIELAEEEEPLKEGGEYFGRPEDYSVKIFAFYECYQCGGPFYGGRKRCDPGGEVVEEEAAPAGERPPGIPERLCSGCSGLSAKCKDHGTDYM